MDVEATLVGLLILAVLISLAADRARIPYTIALVLVGFSVSVFKLGIPFFEDLQLSPHIILYTFLPGLLFEAGYHLDWSSLRYNARAILVYAIPGVLLSTFIVGGLLHLFLGMRWIDALLFGAIISPTDPISVTALMKELGVNPRLSCLIEGESLFNDGVSIVLFGILSAMVGGESQVTFLQSTGALVLSVFGGIVLGFIAGQIFKFLIMLTTDETINIALTFILAYGLFILAEEGFHEIVSPAIAVVVAAIIVGNANRQGQKEYQATSSIIPFWRFVVFVINTIVFLLIGFQLDVTTFGRFKIPVLVSLGVVLISRFVVVYLFRLLLNQRKKSPTLKLSWAHVLFWGGLRGAVSIALVLSLPYSLNTRIELTILTFSYVMFALIVQGLTIKPLLKALKLDRHESVELQS